MDLSKKRVLLYPLLLAFALFLADKVFYLHAIRDRTLHFQKSEPDFYEVRETLFSMMQRQYPSYERDGKRIALVLGSSRSGSLSPADIGAAVPGTVAYNYSVPMGGVTHAYYWTERTLNAGMRPAFLLIEADLANFAEGSLGFMLQYDFDLPFILRHTAALPLLTADPGGFTSDETDTWFLKYCFATFRYPVDPKSIRENYRLIPGGNGLRFLEYRIKTKELLDASTREFTGAIPNVVRVEAGQDFLEKDALFMEGRILNGKPFSKTQYHFFERLLDIAAAGNTPVIVYRPVVSYPLARVLDRNDPDFQDRLKRSIEEKRRQVKASTGTEPQIYYVDPESEGPIQCRAFVDSLHLSGKCYTEVTERIFQSVRLQGFR